jgi:hypothetical protein
LKTTILPMRRIVLILLLLLTALACLPVPAGADDYLTIAQNFLLFRHSSKEIITSEIIEASELDPTLPKIPVAHLFHLKGGGYVLVPASTELTPVKAYSFERDFLALPEAYRTYLSQELGANIRNLQARRGTLGADPATSENRKRWEFLLGLRDVRTAQAYVPDTFLLTTRWNQESPYNKFLPEINGQNTLTGCVNTAIAQLMRYHRHPERGAGVASYTWNSQTLKAILYRPYNWDNMADVASGATPLYQVDEVALLMRDLGIVNHTSFGLNASAAAINISALIQNFAYSNQATSMTNSNLTLFFATIKGEIDALRPVLLVFPGHLTVADGYSSDLSGRKIHVNMGWGGYADDYYYLDQNVQAGGYTFDTTPPNLAIYYNIKPCSGGDCAAPPSNSGPDVAPVIGNAFSNILLTPSSAAPYRILVDARDENGDTLTLSTLNTNGAVLSAQFSGNILELTVLTSAKVSTKITVRAQANGETVDRSFIVLLSDEDVSFGKEFEIRGVFASQQEYDKHKAVLDGACTINGYRGFSNQAFFTGVLNLAQQTVVSMDDVEIQHSFTRNAYLIGASLAQNPGGGGSYYSYSQDYAAYSVTVACPDADETIETIAQLLSIDLSGTQEPQEESTTLSLQAGWNLISLPYTPSNTAISSVLSGIAGQYTVVWGYPNQQWKFYDPTDAEGSTLTSMQPGKGYWIKMTAGRTLTLSGSTPSTSVSLASGWNLVGYNRATSGNASTVLSGIAGSSTIVWGYPSQAWKFWDPSDVEGNTLDTFVGGGGYWIKTTGATTWTLP